jgi:hypothetical protein
VQHDQARFLWVSAAECAKQTVLGGLEGVGRAFLGDGVIEGPELACTKLGSNCASLPTLLGSPMIEPPIPAYTSRLVGNMLVRF